MDQFQRWQQEMLVEVLSGKDLCGCLTHIQEAKAVPVAAALGQICRSDTEKLGGQEVRGSAAARAQLRRQHSSDLGSAVPSFPDAAPASCCSAGTCRRSGRPPFGLAAPSAVREAAGGGRGGQLTTWLAYLGDLGVSCSVSHGLTLVVRMMKMRGEKLWCSSSPGSNLARQL